MHKHFKYALFYLAGVFTAGIFKGILGRVGI